MATLSSTTLSLATTPSALQLTLASLSGITAGTALFLDGETVFVSSTVGSTRVNTLRGWAGSPASAHSAGVTVYIADPSQLYVLDPVGAPPSNPLVSPWINTLTGAVWEVSGGAWVRQASSSTIPDAATAAYPVSTDGVQTLLASAAVDRSVIIQATATAVFANGSGAQPTFKIGQTGSDAKFAATSAFTAAAAGAGFSFSGTLTANTALIVTATAGTGTATGALSVTVIAVPA